MMSRAFVLAALACAVLSTTTARAIARLPETHTWPTDPAPCDAAHTLQQCIDSAFSGDTVQIATKGPIDESISFAKELTLVAAAGVAPVFGGNQTISASTANSAGDQTLVIQGLTLESGHIACLQQGSGTATIEILDDTIQSGFAGGILITASPSTGPVAFQVSHNDLAVPDAQNVGISVDLEGSASATGVIADNRVAMVNQNSTGQELAGIYLSSPDGDLSADVITNRVTAEGGEGPSGISVLRFQGSGTSEVRILDNLATGAQVPMTAGIYANALSGSLSVKIANNTVDGKDLGIDVENGPSGITVGSVANNNITGNAVGLFVGTVGIVSNDHNLFFGNNTDVEGVSAGPGSLFTDPLYAGPGDFHLQPGSPAIDAGDDSAVPATDLDGNPITDLDGHPRIQGARVDIGAYETAPEPDARVLAVTGLVALLGLGRSRGTTAFRSPARRG